MSRNSAVLSAVSSPPWAGAALTLALGVATGVLLTQILVAPAASELGELAAYFTVAGAGTLVLGWLAVRATERGIGLSLRAKAFFGAIAGTAVALLNVLIMAQLMIISTTHDLGLLLAVIGFSGVVTVSFSLWVASTASQRIGAATESIRVLASGDYSARVGVEGTDEVARLAADVNELARRLEDAERQRAAVERERMELSAAISHDLRTPLASMRAMLEAIDDGVVAEAAEVDRYHRALRREIDRLNSMIDDLMELARIDAGALELDRRPVALQEIAAEVVDAMEAQARKADVTMTLELDAEPPPVQVDGARVERAVFNLVRNAIEHTPRGGSVQVRVRGVGVEGDVELSVRDTGDGVDAADLPRIWQRFYRGDKSRARTENGDGAGLGLAIVRGIVEAHGGAVEAAPAPGGGSLFTMRLPRGA